MAVFSEYNHKYGMQAPFCRVEGGLAHWGLYSLPAITGGAEPQELGEIVRAWIEDSMVHHDTPMPQ